MPQLVSDIWLFLWLVLTAWAAYLTGGVITGGVWLFERLSSKRLSRKAIIALYVVVFLLVAFFLVWRDDHGAAQTARHEISRLEAEVQKLNNMILALNGSLEEERRKHTPKLQSELLGVSVGHDTKGVAQVLIFAKITNSGMPSIAHGWRLLVEVPGRGEMFGEQMWIPKKWNVNLADGRVINLSDTDALERKALATPITNGGAIAGALVFRLSSVMQNEFKGLLKVTLFFKDVVGAEYQDSDTRKLIQREPGNFVGMEPIEPHKKSKDKNLPSKSR